MFRQAHRLAKQGPQPCWGALLRRLAVALALAGLRQRGPGEGQDSGSATNLRLALARLPGHDAAAFTLRYFDDLSWEEIDGVLRLNPAAAVSALSRARASLESQLEGRKVKNRCESPVVSPTAAV